MTRFRGIHLFWKLSWGKDHNCDHCPYKDKFCRDMGTIKELADAIFYSSKKKYKKYSPMPPNSPISEIIHRTMMTL